MRRTPSATRSLGTSFIEYALICAIIIGGCAGLFVTLKNNVASRLTSVSNCLTNSNATGC